MDNKKIKIEFAPGCFDGFEGTQEELDALVALIMERAESGELFDNSDQVQVVVYDEDDDELILDRGNILQ